MRLCGYGRFTRTALRIILASYYTAILHDMPFEEKKESCYHEHISP